MDKGRVLRVSALAVFALASVNCTSATTGENVDDEPDVEGRATQASIVLPARCYGKMLKPMPLELEQPIGLAMTIRVNRQCEQGAPLANRKLRIYARRYELGGTAEPQQLLMDWTDWAGAQYRFEHAWTAGSLPGGGQLVPGRYQIYTYSLDSSLYDGWLAGDSYSRHMSTRSDNTYVVLRDGGQWVSSDSGSCSSSCGDGVQAKTNTCEDSAGNALESRMCLALEPPVAVHCNLGPCEPEITPNFVSLMGYEDYGLTPSTSTSGGFQVIGTFKDEETVREVVVKIFFQSRPGMEGDYSATGSPTPGATEAYVTVDWTVPGSSTVSYKTSSASAAIKVRLKSDHRLHAIVNDPGLFRVGGTETISVQADIAIMD